MAHEQNSFLGISWLYSTYMWVWFALLVLTVVEVIVPEPQLIGLAAFPRWVVVLSLIMLALGKTFLVAWYYMHLIDERPSIIGIACAPFIFSVFLTIGLWPHRAQMPEDTKSADAQPAAESVEQASVDGPGAEASSGGMTLAAESFNRRK